MVKFTVTVRYIDGTVNQYRVDKNTTVGELKEMMEDDIPSWIVSAPKKHTMFRLLYKPILHWATMASRNQQPSTAC